jgi:hypothetical protein
MHPMRTRRIAAVALTAAIALLALAAPARADDWSADAPWAAAPAPAPSLTDVSATTQTPWLFSVDGQDFTPDGRVYLAVYDQMGARLYETRWVTASPATAAARHEMGDGRLGRSPAAVPGGDLRESFGGLCGATAMMRALDEGTAAWSNWLPVEPACAAADEYVEPGFGPR